MVSLSDPFDGDAYQDNLDDEYRQILFIIKPYIQRINNPTHIEQYRVWLERLSEAPAEEKLERNKFLLELANQIYGDKLKAPFTRDPPAGPLSSIKKFNKNNHQVWSSTQLPSAKVKKKNRKPITFEKLGKSSDDDSSWCDLSGATSLSTLACGDTDKSETDDDETGGLANKVSLMHKLEGLKARKRYSKKIEEDVSKRTSNFSVKDQDLDDAEVAALKSRIKDLVEVKNALRDTHFLTEDRKRVLEKLQTKVYTMETKNSELKAVIDLQTKKIIELEMSKSKIQNDYNEKCSSFPGSELESVKERHDAEVLDVEKAFQAKMLEAQNEFQKQIENIQESYEKKIKELVASHEVLMKEKDDEIFRLNQEAKLKIDASASSEQVNHLKKCISKMDKLLQKSEKDYTQKIEKLKQELDMKEMTMQMKLQTQKADLVIRSSATKQGEISSAINSLEAKYKNMLELQKLQAMEVQGQNERVIGELRNILNKHEIPYK